MNSKCFDMRSEIPAHSGRGFSGTHIGVGDSQDEGRAVAGCRVLSAGCRVQDSGSRVQGPGSRVQGSGLGFRIGVQGSRYRRAPPPLLHREPALAPASGCRVEGVGLRVKG